MRRVPGPHVEGSPQGYRSPRPHRRGGRRQAHVHCLRGVSSRLPCFARTPPEASATPMEGRERRCDSKLETSRRSCTTSTETLVDPNYEHTIAWACAFKEAGVEVPTWRIHRHVGMGGDQLVPAVAGEDVAERLGDRIRELEKDRYRELIGEVRPFPGAEDILAACRDAGVAVILASSAKGDELERCAPNARRDPANRSAES